MKAQPNLIETLEEQAEKASEMASQAAQTQCQVGSVDGNQGLSTGVQHSIATQNVSGPWAELGRD